MSAANEATVRNFLAAWQGTPDPARLASFFAERSFFYPNRDWSPYIGREAIRQRWQRLQVRDVDVEVLHVASVGETVLVERVDRYTLADTGERLEMPVASAADLDDQGLIRNWRDYFPTTPPPSRLP
jgi:limonene-1,2-epoxide hydrolase